MKVLIIGGAGMVGRKLAERLAKDGKLGGKPISSLALYDVVPPQKPAGASFPVEIVTGDFPAPGESDKLVANKPDVIFHLAAIVSGEAEQEFDKGYRINLHGTMNLLESVRRAGNKPRLVFTSSIAVFGAPFPEKIGDEFFSTPLTSYGTQKAIGELLISDYTRKGMLDGISIRLPTICVRPGAPRRVPPRGSGLAEACACASIGRPSRARSAADQGQERVGGTGAPEPEARVLRRERDGAVDVRDPSRRRARAGEAEPVPRGRTGRGPRAVCYDSTHGSARPGGTLGRRPPLAASGALDPLGRRRRGGRLVGLGPVVVIADAQLLQDLAEDAHSASSLGVWWGRPGLLQVRCRRQRPAIIRQNGALRPAATPP